MAYRLIAVDVDGTLLRSDGTLSPRTRDALASAVDRGATLVVATGRRRRTALPIVAQLELPHFLAASQGAVVWQDDDIIAHSHLPRDSARIVLQILARRNMPCVVFGSTFRPETLWAAGDWRANERLARYLLEGDRGHNARLMRELRDGCLEHDPIEIIVFDTYERLDALDEALTGHAPPPPAPDAPLQPGPNESRPLWRVIYSRNQFSGGGAIEIVGPDTSKAAALDAVCARLGISAAEVVAFGDNVNDVEMLEFAGLGVAMGNSTEEARCAAARIAPANDDDGIACVLEDLGLA